MFSGVSCQCQALRTSEPPLPFCLNFNILKVCISFFLWTYHMVYFSNLKTQWLIRNCNRVCGCMYVTELQNDTWMKL